MNKNLSRNVAIGAAIILTSLIVIMREPQLVPGGTASLGWLRSEQIEELFIPSESALNYFIQKAEEQVVLEKGSIPTSEGLTGFMLIEVFPGIVPADFLGVSTRHGDYIVNDGILYFYGNAPSDAAQMTHQGMATILRNIAERLSMPASTEEQVNSILEKIQ